MYDLQPSSMRCKNATYTFFWQILYELFQIIYKNMLGVVYQIPLEIHVPPWKHCRQATSEQYLKIPLLSDWLYSQCQWGDNFITLHLQQSHNETMHDQEVNKQWTPCCKVSFGGFWVSSNSLRAYPTLPNFPSVQTSEPTEVKKSLMRNSESINQCISMKTHR